MLEREKDLVCGMEVEKTTADGPVDFEGRQFYFCSPGCKEKFANNPQEYLGKEQSGGSQQ